jgi:nicotinate-nucleotide--dimethylbenzimidazole phosphoribosyltransferase
MSPFDDIRALLAELPEPDEVARQRAAGSPGLAGLGRLAETVGWLAAWSGRTPPLPARPVIALYVGAHAAAPGDGHERERLEAFAAGRASVNAMAQRLGAGLDAYDLAVDRPVPDIRTQPAMSERACAATLAFGMEALAKTPDLLLIGEAGGGGILSSAALAYALHGGELGGSGEQSEGVRQAATRARSEGAGAGLELLAQLGGRETAAMAGAIVAARVQRTPVVLDGFAAAAAAAALHAEAPDALDHCLAAHAQHPAHATLLERLGLAPLLDIGISAGEGVGAAAALSLIQLACAAAASGSGPATTGGG